MSASVLIWMISSFRWDIWFKVILFFLKSSGMYGICCLYCLLPFYQSILSSLRRSVASTSSGAESSVKAFFHFAKIIIFSENLSFFCCFFLFFRFHDCCIRSHVCRIRSHVCRIRSHDSVVIFLFRMFVSHALKGQKLLAQGSALGYDVRKLVAL